MAKASKATGKGTDARTEALLGAIGHIRSALDDLERALSAPPASLETVATTSRREVMKPSDYADYMRVNVRKVHAWLKEGMPHFMLEGRVRIRVKQADDWLLARGES